MEFQGVVELAQGEELRKIQWEQQHSRFQGTAGISTDLVNEVFLCHQLVYQPVVVLQQFSVCLDLLMFAVYLAELFDQFLLSLGYPPGLLPHWAHLRVLPARLRYLVHPLTPA